MNFRKDIYERVKYIMKEQSEMKVNCSKLGRQFNCDRRTVSRYVELAKNGEKPSQRVYQKKTDGFEHIIEEKVKTSDSYLPLPCQRTRIHRQLFDNQEIHSQSEHRETERRCYPF